MNKHTPGPWVKAKYKVSTPSGGLIANTRSTGEASSDDEANARLISAAPELLECLQWAMQTGRLNYVGRTNGNADYCDAVDRANAAIAKATGGKS